MLPGNSIERLLCLLETVGYHMLKVESRSPRIQERYDLHKHRLERARRHPARRGQRLHTDGTADGYVARVEGEPRLNHADEEGIQRVVLWEYYFILQLALQRVLKGLFR